MVVCCTNSNGLPRVSPPWLTRGCHDVQLEYEGEDNFLGDGELVQSFNNYGSRCDCSRAPIPRIY